MDFFKKKSNLIMIIVVAVLVIGGIVGAFAMSGKNDTEKEAHAIAQEQEPDNEAETAEEANAKDSDKVKDDAENAKDSEKKSEKEESPKEDSKKVDSSGDTSSGEPVDDSRETESTVTPELTPETIPEQVPEATPEPTPEAIPEEVPEAIPEEAPEAIPEAAPEVTPEAAPEPTPEVIPEPTPEPIPEKKTCTISIRCDTVLNNMSNLTPGKEGCVPASGYILSKTTMEFSEGETVYDVLKRACSNNGIQIEAAYTPAYGSYYVEGINNLYEFDCGPDSGWMYKVNDWFPNYGSSSYTVENGDNIVWCYTCNGLGADVGA